MQPMCCLNYLHCGGTLLHLALRTVSEHCLVSVIVVNWNGLHLLEDCFSSLARQTWKQTEFILVDNGSTDGSRDLIVSWAGRLPNAQTILLSYNSGFCKANNLAFAKARGECPLAFTVMANAHRKTFLCRNEFRESCPQPAVDVRPHGTHIS